ncbi:MAG: hypothetical protein EBX52_01305 [Proteobacteria bacterium]|nr:hypothetical protein [Pseudomonadota bacterium]
MKRVGRGAMKDFAGWMIPFFLFVSPAHAEPSAKSALEISDQFIFAPNNLSLEQFALDTDLKWSWVLGSFEWIRVAHKFQIPRARARLSVPKGTLVRYQDRVFTAVSDSVEVPVVLSGEAGNQLEIGGVKPVRIGVRFVGSERIDTPVVLDSTCSQLPIRVEGTPVRHSWIYVYCHGVHPARDSGYSNRVDVDLRWETEGSAETLRVNGLEVPSPDGVTHSLSLTPEIQSYHLEKGKDSIDLKIPVAEKFHAAWVSMGIGPYSHRDVVRAFPTFYVGYYFSESMRLASFSAIPIKPNPEIDSGVYLVSEQFRGLDERLHLSLLLGAHVLNFTPASGKRTSVMSAPQGIEMGFRDFLLRSQNLTFGSFFYPKIADRSYINTWIRYGNGRLFFEFNFIQWQEPTESGPFRRWGFL